MYIQYIRRTRISSSQSDSIGAIEVRSISQYRIVGRESRKVQSDKGIRRGSIIKEEAGSIGTNPIARSIYDELQGRGGERVNLKDAYKADGEEMELEEMVER